MSLESIINRILDKAKEEKENILSKARLEADKIIKDANIEAERIYRSILDKEKALYERERQRLIVNARLKHKMKLLEAKQDLIEKVFENLKSALKGHKVKKEEVFIDKVKEVPEEVDFYLMKLRYDYETEVSRILF